VSLPSVHPLATWEEVSAASTSVPPPERPRGPASTAEKHSCSRCCRDWRGLASRASLLSCSLPFLLWTLCLQPLFAYAMPGSSESLGRTEKKQEVYSIRSAPFPLLALLDDPFFPAFFLPVNLPLSPLCSVGLDLSSFHLQLTHTLLLGFATYPLCLLTSSFFFLSFSPLFSLIALQSAALKLGRQ